MPKMLTPTMSLPSLRRTSLHTGLKRTGDPFPALLSQQTGVLLFAAVIAIVAVCAGILITDTSRIRDQRTGDFEHFYYAALGMRQGSDPYATHTHGYIYPPLIAFLFQPLSLLSRNHAATLMLGLNVCITLLAIGLAVDEFIRRMEMPRTLVCCLWLSLGAMVLNIDKIKGEWQMWQTDVWMLLLFVVSLRWIDRRPWMAGLALGLAINIKYIPLIFLPYLLIRRRWAAASGLVLGILFFAMLPASSTGFSANAHNWRTATNGIVQMTSRHPAPGQAAEVHDVKDSLSCSITSAMARALASHPSNGFLLSAGILIGCIGLATGMYRHRHIGLFTAGRGENPLLTGIEWVMLIAVALAFSPQTNTRHLFDALIFTSAACVVLSFAKPTTPRWPLLIGTAVLFLGFILPPGSRTFRGERTPAILWLRMAGPCWCLLIAAFSLLWTGLKEVQSAEPRR
jgi:hypothetical protein